MKNKIILFNPPGKILIRGEGRSDSETDPATSSAAAKWIYPPMNLAYGAACLRQAGFDPSLVDYPAEGKGLKVLEQDLLVFKPQVCVTNINPSSEVDDVAAIKVVRSMVPHCKVIAYAPYLTIYGLKDLPEEVLNSCDVLLIAEHPETLGLVAQALLSGEWTKLKTLEGLLYCDRNSGEIIKTKYPPPCDLNKLPLPARDLLNNNLYVRPDNGKVQALIQTGRGCPFDCTFCLVPPMTGKAFTVRSVESVMEEIRDCVENHGINNVFFRADTFTVNQKWVKELAQAIIDSGLKISWCANSRAHIINEEMLHLMKRSGCWLLAFGFESGCPETLKRIRKGNTMADNERARKLCRKFKIKVLGQYVIGFPWEGRVEIEQTSTHIKRMQCDFIDIQVLVPYKGTEIYEEMKNTCPQLIDRDRGSKIQGGVIGTAKGLTKNDLIYYQIRMLRSTYLSPHSILSKALAIRSFGELKNYSRYGLKFILNQFFRSINNREKELVKK